MPSTITVTNAHNSGTGSLRQAILTSNANPGASGPNLINFNLPSNISGKISPLTPLPAITSPVVIDGSLPSGPLVLIGNGTTVENGLTINAAGCTIRNLDIGGWLGDGILINSNDNIIEGDSIGMLGGPDPNGTGIVITGDSNTIGGTTAANANVIVLNRYSGIVIENGQENQIEGNFIGNGIPILSSGNTIDGRSQGNGLDGVKIEGAASQNNTIGGTTAGASNVISGNAIFGVAIIAGASANTVVANYIGTNLGGTAVETDMGNGSDGVYIGSGAHGNFIGTTATGGEGRTVGIGNVISGNRAYGVEIQGVGTEFNVLTSNRIGTDITGTEPLPNEFSGVLIHGGATYNLVGTNQPVLDNVISGNKNQGVIISGAGTKDNYLINNYIGTNLGGSAALANGSYGVWVEAGAKDNYVGTPGSPNVISGNTDAAGVYIVDVGTKGNMVEGNLIGVDVTDSVKLGNFIGVAIAVGATDNTVGGTTASAGNVISGNVRQGVFIGDAGTTGNMIEGNEIGTNQAGTIALGNGLSGVVIANGASGNTVGGTQTVAGNTISGNGDDGIDITNANTDNNTVEENLIGTNSLGTAALGNDSYGVVISGGATNNAVTYLNVISGNTLDGVLISGAGTTANGVENNLIGLNEAGNGAVPNGTNGVTIDLGASANGVVSNRISGNTDDGIHISGATTEDNGIEGNFIGLAVDEVTPVPNSNGIIIDAGSNDNVIGSPGNGNTIADNTHDGIAIIGNTSIGNTISQNSIYGNGGIGIDLGNTGTPTTNTPGGFHVGPNDLLNYPVLTAGTTPGFVNVSLNSTPLTGFTIEFFSSATNAPGQGETYLGSVSVKTDKFGNASFIFSFTPTVASPYLTATATDSTIENTSEFSAPLGLPASN
jgi:titin